MRSKARAVSPISSRLLVTTSCCRSPSEIPSAAWSIWRTPPVMARAMKNARPAPMAAAASSSAMTIVRAVLDVERAEASAASASVTLYLFHARPSADSLSKSVPAASSSRDAASRFPVRTSSSMPAVVWR